MIMKTMKFQLIFAALLVCAMGVSAQNPYAEIEADGDEYATVVKFAGQKPGITDFVSAYIGDEPEDELTGALYEMWHKHLKNKPLDKNEKITVDAKNGFVRFEQLYPDEGDGYGDESLFVEMCYWNCSDGKHKIFASSVSQYHDGEAIQTEFGGIIFGVYNNDTHKMIFNNGCGLGVCDSWDGNPIVTYTLPRVGKDITAVLHTPDDIKEATYKWNGLKFELQK